MTKVAKASAPVNGTSISPVRIALLHFYVFSPPGNGRSSSASCSLFPPVLAFFLLFTPSIPISISISISISTSIHLGSLDTPFILPQVVNVAIILVIVGVYAIFGLPAAVYAIVLSLLYPQAHPHQAVLDTDQLLLGAHIIQI